METHFTKGPWVIKQSFSNRFEIQYQKEGAAPDHVASVYHDHGPHNDQANAHLISCAPSMYKEIETAEKFLTDSGYDKVDPSEPEYQMLMGFRDILAKARGEGV